MCTNHLHVTLSNLLSIGYIDVGKRLKLAVYSIFASDYLARNVHWRSEYDVELIG